MELTKYKLGKLIEQCDNRNTDEEYTADDVRGISTGKEFIETKANMDGVSLTSYKIGDINLYWLHLSRSCRVSGVKQALHMKKMS